jgi:hypothetical protein
LGSRNQPDEQTSTQQFRLDPSAQQGLNRGLGELLNAYMMQQSQGGVPLAPLSNPTMQGIDAITRRAQYGSPLVNQASQFSQGLLSTDPMSFASRVQAAGVRDNPFSTGAYANPFASGSMTNAAPTMSSFAFGDSINPYLDQVFNAAADSTQNRLASEFASAGRFNSPAQQQSRSQELQNLAAGIYAPGYEAERSRQFGAAEAGLDRGFSQTEANLGRQFAGIESNLGRQFSGIEGNLSRQLASTQGNADRTAQLLDSERQRQLGLLGFIPTLANQGYTDAAQLLGAGSLLDSRAQMEADRSGANLDQLLTRLGSIVPMFGGQQSMTSPLYSNPLAGFAGGALLGQQLAPSIGALPPFGRRDPVGWMQSPNDPFGSFDLSRIAALRV